MSKARQCRYEKLVKGYIRAETKHIAKKQIFPSDIQNVIFDFYYYYEDKWYEKWVQRYIIIDGLKVKNNEYHNGSAFGSIIIEPGMIHSWSIKLLHWNNKSVHGTGHGPWIGIIKDKDSLLQKWYYNTGWARDGSGYAFVCGEARLEGKGNKNSNGKYGVKFINKEDIMTMVLDTSKWTLSYDINGVDYGVAFENLDKCNYRLSVTISAFMNDTEIELI